MTRTKPAARKRFDKPPCVMGTSQVELEVLASSSYIFWVFRSVPSGCKKKKSHVEMYLYPSCSCGL